MAAETLIPASLLNRVPAGLVSRSTCQGLPELNGFSGWGGVKTHACPKPRVCDDPFGAESFLTSTH